MKQEKDARGQHHEIHTELRTNLYQPDSYSWICLGWNWSVHAFCGCLPSDFKDLISKERAARQQIEAGHTLFTYFGFFWPRPYCLLGCNKQELLQKETSERSRHHETIGERVPRPPPEVSSTGVWPARLCCDFALKLYRSAERCFRMFLGLLVLDLRS